jgi:predicted DNA-binding protein (MmcQ/YjbR family)
VKFKPVPLPIRRLMLEMNRRIMSLSGVRHAWMWGTRNYKIGDKLFICFVMKPEGLVLEFKVPPDLAKPAIRRSLARPSAWKSMAANGWIEVRMSQAKQIRAVMPLIEASHRLHQEQTTRADR